MFVYFTVSPVAMALSCFFILDEQGMGRTPTEQVIPKRNLSKLHKGTIFLRETSIFFLEFSVVHLDKSDAVRL